MLKSPANIELALYWSSICSKESTKCVTLPEGALQISITLKSQNLSLIFTPIHLILSVLIFKLRGSDIKVLLIKIETPPPCFSSL